MGLVLFHLKEDMARNCVLIDEGVYGRYIYIGKELLRFNL